MPSPTNTAWSWRLPECGCSIINGAFKHLSGRVAKVASIVLLAFPVLTGLLVPTVTLDANTVSAKGYHFPLAAGSDPNQADQEGTTIQYLKPDTSSYFMRMK